jgi:uncharacterized membrane protein YgcG
MILSSNFLRLRQQIYLFKNKFGFYQKSYYICILNLKLMKKIIFIASFLGLSLGLNSCGEPQVSAQTNNVTINQSQPSNIDVQTANVPGFDVNEFANLLKNTKDPQTIEQAINQPNNKINNLDLNNDGNIDYLKVVESANHTLTVVDETSATNSVTVATLTVNPQQQTMQIAGNQAYCGNTYMYTSHYTVGDWLFMSYFLYPHSYYVPMYHWGYYPRYYHPYRSYYGYGYSRPYYRQTYRTTNVYRNTYRTSNYRSGYRPTSSYTPRQSISSPKTSQRSFSVRNSSSPVRSGGFGRSSSGFSSSRSSFGGGRSSFGGGRSSFGGGRRR